MSSFDQNFQSLVKLKKDRLGLEADQQRFDQDETFFRREGELKAQRLGNERSRFEIDRAKGFMPIEMQSARVGLQGLMNNVTSQQDQANLNRRLGQIDVENRTADQMRSGNDYNYQTGRRKIVDSQQDASYARQGVMDMRQDADYNYQTGRRSLVDARSDTRQGVADMQQNADYTYQAGRRGIVDARNDADYGYQTGRRSLMDTRSDTEYMRNQASNYGYSSSPPINFAQSQQGQPAIQSNSSTSSGVSAAPTPRQTESEMYDLNRRRMLDHRSDIEYEQRKLGYADGGPVQDVQAKGFVPVRVSNGEFEFTPEQVANIGAAVLANGGGKAQTPMGLDSMG